MLLLSHLTSLLLFATWLNLSYIHASAPPPDVRASRSANGQFMVVVDRDLEPAQTPDGGRRIIRTTYRILAQEKFLNSKDRLTASAPFFSQVCETNLEGNDGRRQFWPMVSDNGKSLVLIAVTPPAPNQDLLAVYRCEGGFGKLVRNFQITDLASANQAAQLARRAFMITDATPQWFAGGSFVFSGNNQFLIYRSPANDRIQIRLQDGSLTKGDSPLSLTP